MKREDFKYLQKISRNKFIGIHEDDRQYRIAKEYFFHLKIIDDKRGFVSRLTLNKYFMGQKLYCTFVQKL